MRKLVIGCGYLGERVAQAWRRDGHEVWVLTRSAERGRLFAGCGFKSVIGDVLDPNSLHELPPSETVLYAVGFDRTSTASKREVYVAGLRNVLTALREKCRRLIYISSTSVYGQNAGELVDESSPIVPCEENGCITRDAEVVVWQHFERASPASMTSSRDAIILRLAGIYGPGRLLARIQQLQNGERFSGNAEAWLNLIHVEDAVKAVLAAEERGRSGETYLVCDDRPLQRREYYTALAERLGAPSPVFAELAPDSAERLRINKRCLNRRLRQELGVELEYPTIIDGLRTLPEARQ